MGRPLHHSFEDDLEELVDRYLLLGIEIEKLKMVLAYEAKNDHEQVLTDLTKKGFQNARS